jgi:pyruvate/2-oxoglutarate dehydrogenase complex dihydrolipoamide dehydrogenase (E3) component
VDVIRYLTLMAERAGVDIRLNTRVTPEMVSATKAGAVILATGGIPLTITFPGLEKTRWMQAADLLDGVVEVKTPTALVVGGGLVGLEAADFLAAKGVKVTVVEMLDQVGIDMDPLAKAMLTKRLNARDVEIFTGTKVLRLAERNVVAQQAGRETTLPLETVVIAVGVRPNRTLLDALDENDLEVHVIGDAVEPRRALEAIREGFEVGNRV